MDDGTLALLRFVSQTSRLLDRLLAETAAAWQISPSEVRVLLFLSCMPHLDTARDVALHCGMSKASVSGNVLKLVTRGLLTAEMDLTDRRFQRLALTEQAEPVADAIRDAIQRLREELLGKGYTFQSQTDTEIAAALIDSCYAGDPAEAIRAVLAGCKEQLQPAQ